MNAAPHGAQKITAITVHHEGGQTTYYGSGTFSVVSTQTKEEDRPPASWPWLTFVSASMVIEAKP